jgi:hypothetical protein
MKQTCDSPYWIRTGSPGGTFYSGGFGLKDNCYLRVSWGIDSFISTVVVRAQYNLKERNIIDNQNNSDPFADVERG